MARERRSNEGSKGKWKWEDRRGKDERRRVEVQNKREREKKEEVAEEKAAAKKKAEEERLSRLSAADQKKVCPSIPFQGLSVERSLNFFL